MSRFLCDRCLTPFNSYDCDPAIVPAGEDWSELCPSCQERRLYFRQIDAEPEPEDEQLEAAE
jgi:hypothetical protein